jgi:hypothetical protein
LNLIEIRWVLAAPTDSPLCPSKEHSFIRGLAQQAGLDFPAKGDSSCSISSSSARFISRFIAMAPYAEERSRFLALLVQESVYADVDLEMKTKATNQSTKSGTFFRASLVQQKRMVC